MDLKEYLLYRKELIEQASDENGFVSESLILAEIQPSLLETKLVDSEDITNCYTLLPDNSKLNAYQVNESGERLQVFLVNETFINSTLSGSQLFVSQKSDYDSQFKRASRFINKALKGHLNDELQDGDLSRPLIARLSSPEGIHEIDVIEIFLISLSLTVSLQTATPSIKNIEFEDEEIQISYSLNREKTNKSILIKKRLIDIPYLYNVQLSEGNREPLVIDFESFYGKGISAIKAADESNFESYLCVLPATLISSLYKVHSSRLLEKNVRSFLQFRGVNSGIRETIRKEPEKFIAYNNGLTITAIDAKIEQQNGVYFILSLTDFQIVNGGQTTATIYFTQKDGYDINKVNVMAKINIAKESSTNELEELITNISTYSNAQSRVSKVDLRSRNTELIKLKTLSESIVTPSGKKWFFERAKGEFNTKLRASKSRKAAILKEYPTERRFTKEDLAKYFSSWGDQPFMIKKGGEKVFRYFIEKLSGDGNKLKAQVVDRTFYEDLIGRVILFRQYEKLYGQGKNSMGQIRSAVVPYSISILYSYTDGSKQKIYFDLLKIWKDEGFDEFFRKYSIDLLHLVNSLIKKYALSDDLGEYSKKEELWKNIIQSSEIKDFMTSKESAKVLSTFTISESEKLKRQKSKKGYVPIDFSYITGNASIHSNGELFYKKIATLYSSELTSNEDRKLSVVIAAIQNSELLNSDLIEFEKNLIRKIRSTQPEIFDLLPDRSADYIEETLDLVVRKYNHIVNNGLNLDSEFEKLERIAEAKDLKYTSVLNLIKKQLQNGDVPTIDQLKKSSGIFKFFNDQIKTSN